MTDPFETLREALADHYALEREIGEGGMATVYLARDLRLDRAVAIKVLKPDLTASLGVERFLREIRVAAQLQHPNILGVYDSGEAAGYLYYVMPFVSGESLRDRLNREQQLSLPDAIEITREVASALSYAHSSGVVHRDIKPENILLMGGKALVADFGIARAVDQAGGEKLTKTGMSVGTPVYMSPEQAAGDAHVDGRSDEYSLACVLYELLAGQPPFTGPTAMAIMARHSMEQVPGLRIVRAAIPEEVEQAIFQALEKVPADRFATVAQFADALTATPSGAFVRRTGSRQLPAARRTVATRRRWILIAGGGLLLLALAAAGWRYWRQRPGGGDPGFDPRRIAVLYFQNRSGQDSLNFLSDGLTEALIHELSQVTALQVISRNGVSPYRGTKVTADSVAKVLKIGTLVDGTVAQAGGKLRVDVSLVNARTGEEIGSKTLERPREEIFALQDDLAKEVALFLRERLGQEIKVQESRKGTRNAGAWALLQQAEQARRAADSLAQARDSTGAADQRFDLADSLLAAAEAQDRSWSDPIVTRGAIAYRRSRLAVEDPLKAGKWISKGMEHVDRAIKLDPQNPDALELRGNLRYWKWLLGLAPDANEAKQLLTAAREDLEAAVKISPSQAGAWSTLSHLYYQTGSQVDVKLAALRAYEEDAYLSNADVIVSRLFFASYDLGQFPDAIHWCDEGKRRFPRQPKFTQCQLLLMASKAKEPDVQLAWRLVDTLVAQVPPGEQAFERLYGQMTVGGVLARAGLKDSARHVARRSRGDAQLDPSRDLTLLEAFVYDLLSDRDAALNALKEYFAANPERRANYAEDPGWWFRDLQDDPGFRQIVGSKQ